MGCVNDHVCSQLLVVLLFVLVGRSDSLDCLNEKDHKGSMLLDVFGIFGVSEPPN